MGRNYLVVPVVALVEGVVQGLNAESPELALAEEFGRVPESWNGRPVVMNHPIINEIPTSANAPEVLEQYFMGYTFNTRIGDDKKLRTEAWLDTERINALGGEAKSTLERIQGGQVVEVSTGLFTGIEELSGDYTDGSHYDSIWRDVLPDHLAFLSEGTKGACSIEMGCGTPRVNTQATTPNGVTPASTQHTQLTALRVNTTAERWNDCGCSHKKGNQMPTDQTTEQADPNLLLTNTEHPERVFNVARFVANAYPNTMVSSDVNSLLRNALREQFQQELGRSEYLYLIGFTQDKVIFETWDFDADTYSTYQQSFSISEDKQVTFANDRQKVIITMQITPVTTATTDPASTTTTTTQPRTNSTGDTPMAEENNGQNTPKPNDTTQPNQGAQTQTTQQVTEPNTTQQVQEPAQTATVQANSQNQPNQPNPPAPRALSTQEYIAQAPAEIQAMLTEGLALRNQKREAVIKSLRSTNRCKFTDQQLAAMDLTTLEDLAELAAVPVYTGQNPAPTELRDQANSVPSMPPLIPPKTQAA